MECFLPSQWREVERDGSPLLSFLHPENRKSLLSGDDVNGKVYAVPCSTLWSGVPNISSDKFLQPGTEVNDSSGRHNDNQIICFTDVRCREKSLHNAVKLTNDIDGQRREGWTSGDGEGCTLNDDACERTLVNHHSEIQSSGSKETSTMDSGYTSSVLSTTSPILICDNSIIENVEETDDEECVLRAKESPLPGLSLIHHKLSRLHEKSATLDYQPSPVPAECTSKVVPFTRLVDATQPPIEVVDYSKTALSTKKPPIEVVDYSRTALSTTKPSIEVVDYSKTALSKTKPSIEVVDYSKTALSTKKPPVDYSRTALSTKKPPIEVMDLTQDGDVIVIDEVERRDRREVGAVATCCGIVLTQADLDTLQPNCWLNDQVINAFMKLLMSSYSTSVISKGSGINAIHIVSSFFYTKLCTAGYAGVERWLKTVDLFRLKLLLVPVHLGFHWCLAAINFRNKSISYFDSMGGKNITCLKTLKLFLVRCSLAARARPVRHWRLCHSKGIPRQNNCSDCGVFVCQFARWLCSTGTRPRSKSHSKIPFSHKHMSRFRSLMVQQLKHENLYPNYIHK